MNAAAGFIACDSKFAHFAKNCIASLGNLPALPLDFWLISLGLDREDLEWFAARGVSIYSDHQKIPLPDGLPEYTRAQICRPLLRQIFPKYEYYIWIDADLVFLNPNALAFFVERTTEFPEGAACSLELDWAYAFVHNWEKANTYHNQRSARMSQVYPARICDFLGKVYHYNSGLFCLNRKSRVWTPYADNLQTALAAPGFNHISEQDAFNVALAISDAPICDAGAYRNWLCSAALPRFDQSLSAWTSPEEPFGRIAVAHLSGSSGLVCPPPSTVTFTDVYRRIGLLKDY